MKIGLWTHDLNRSTGSLFQKVDFLQWNFGGLYVDYDFDLPWELCFVNTLILIFSCIGKAEFSAWHSP